MPEPPVDDVSGELLEVYRRRKKEARQAGLSNAEAKRFAAGSQDVGLLRLLVKSGCAPELIARIVL